jgi:hypothetical protein
VIPPEWAYQGCVPGTDDGDEEARRVAEQLEDGSLDPDELNDEPALWDEGSDDET